MMPDQSIDIDNYKSSYYNQRIRFGKLMQYTSILTYIFSLVLIFNSYRKLSQSFLYKKWDERDKEQHPQLFENSVYFYTLLGCSFVYTLEMIVNYKKKNLNLYVAIEIGAGPAALIFDSFTFYYYRRVAMVSIIFKLLYGFTIKRFRILISMIFRIIPKIAGLFFTIWSLFYFFTYAACYMYEGLEFSQNYFSNLMYSTFTMLQVMTLDGWGQIGRDILQRQNFMSSMWLVLFIFILFFFFWNILIGVILDIFIQFREEKTHFNDEDIHKDSFLICFQHGHSHIGHMENQLSRAISHELHHDCGIKDKQKMNKHYQKKGNFSVESLLEGNLYEFLFVFLWLLSQANAYTCAQITQLHLTYHIVFSFTLSSIYTLHTICYLFYNKYGDWRQIDLLFLHILSGPLALLADIVQYQMVGYVGISGMLQVFKVMTVPTIKLILLSSITIFPILMPPFTAILGLIFMMGLWGSYYLSQYGDEFGYYWVDYETSVYTFIQVLTLDDWSARLLQILSKKGLIFQADLFVLFIFLANFFFLNIMIAFSSQCFATKEEDQINYDFYEKQCLYFNPDHYSVGNYQTNFQNFTEQYWKIQIKYSTESSLRNKIINLQKDVVKRSNQPIRIEFQGRSCVITPDLILFDTSCYNN